ncbi:MAG: NUDIX hydrolase [Planctomycetota bacterium]|nr:NUDIX hydrolase [Planctomycetota bacterium]
MLPWVVSQREEVFATRRWRVERSMRRREGEGKEHLFHTIRIADFVNVVACTVAQELVMVRQFRHGVEAPTLEFPGGLVDPGESDVAEAARRELLEETGYDGVLAPLGVIHPNPALLNNRCHLFLVEAARRVAAPRLEETEDVELVLVPREQWGAPGGVPLHGSLTNAMTLAALALWRARVGV